MTSTQGLPATLGGRIRSLICQFVEYIVNRLAYSSHYRRPPPRPRLRPKPERKRKMESRPLL